MAVTKQKKVEVLNNLKELLLEAKSVWFTTNSGLTVENITELRKNLREVWATCILAKKTLIKKAFAEVMNVEISDELLPNQIAMILCTSDAVAWLGKVNKFMSSDKKMKDKIVWAGWFFEWKVQNAKEIASIADMPSRETLLGRLVGSMMSPLSGFARFLDAASKELETQGKEKVAQLKAK